jgi:hypothetical protein
MKQPKKIKVRVIADGSVERNHTEMMKYLNVTYIPQDTLCGVKFKYLYGHLYPGRKLRKLPTYFGKNVFCNRDWLLSRSEKRDAYCVQETIGGWRQNAAFYGTWYECVEWLAEHQNSGNYDIVHESEYDVDYL